MRVRFLLGPAGCGKTHLCLQEVRGALRDAPDGPPLLFIAPRQSTYEIERLLLTEPSLQGYTRLHVLSLERLAAWVLDRLGKPIPDLLDEQGRIMVLRGLLTRNRGRLNIFRASARLVGFAQQLSAMLGELERQQLDAGKLRGAAATATPALARKLEDFALILEAYQTWLRDHRLQDDECLLTHTAKQLQADSPAAIAVLPEPVIRLAEPFRPRLDIAGLWVDGFTEFSAGEINLLASLLPHCAGATFSFCTDPSAAGRASWLSPWSLVNRTVDHCRRVFSEVPGLFIEDVTIKAESPERFCESPPLAHLASCWARPRAFTTTGNGVEPLSSALRIVACPSCDAETFVAAREIWRHVRAGGRFREVAVLVRNLEGYHAPLVRTFSRHEIPFFIDRRESVSHHPLAELTRGILRTIAFNWRNEDWFSVLKTGLLPISDAEVDELENEALAHGWNGAKWRKLPAVTENPDLTNRLHRLVDRLLPPFTRLAAALAAGETSGRDFAAALRQLWADLRIEETLQGWSDAEHPFAGTALPNPVHDTVWGEMNTWLDNLELGFGDEALPLREWLPVVEAGLAGLTVGVIPPGLDQVLIGSVDRSRNPDVQLVLLLGLNEGVFPARPQSDLLLTDDEQEELQNRNLVERWGRTDQLSRERLHAYTGFTRARRRLVLTHAASDERGTLLNPSPFLGQLRALFPQLETEPAAAALDWRLGEHPGELAVPWLKSQSASPAPGFLEPLLSGLDRCQLPGAAEMLDPALARQLYGTVLRTSVSRLEQFAACPFRFFVNSGLRVEERKRFELDVKEQGSFQHDCLAHFHEELKRRGQRWRDVEPKAARALMAEIAGKLAADYRGGLLQSSEETRFQAGVMSQSLQDFVEILVGWMRSQYQFDPAVVELPFGDAGEPAAWALELGGGLSLHLKGRIDRVDVCRDEATGDGWIVVVDYKSSQKKLESVFVHNGIQLQLLAYLNVLRQWPELGARLGFKRLAPAGVFYVNLRGKHSSEPSRTEALADPEQSRRLAYRHTGRFDLCALKQLDSRTGVTTGDQFNFRLKRDGTPYANCQEAVSTAAFTALLDGVEKNLRTMGRQIYEGTTGIAPYRRGSKTACDDCAYRSVCRLDPWLQPFRSLPEPP